MILDWLFRNKIKGRKKIKEKRKIECIELHTDEELKKAIIEAIDSAKSEIIIITDDFKL